MRRAAIGGLGALLALAAAFATPAAAQQAQGDAPARQSLDDVWWTGPLLAPASGSLPKGHVLFEPYFYDVIADGRFDARGARHGAPRTDTYGSQSYLNYGLADRFTVGLIPRFGYTQPSSGRASSHPAVGDLTAQAQYQLTQFHPGNWMPTLSVNLQETLPTGRYDHLDRMSDGFGSGAYATSLALYSQTYFWTPNGRILRTRLDLTWTRSARVGLEGMSVYGTPEGFRGRADPGDSVQADLGFEYSATRNWVLALDLAYEHDASTRVSGVCGGASPACSGPFSLASGPAETVWVAPAVEYNFSGAVGVIVGARLEPAGRNTSASVTPVAAINIVY